MVFLGSDHAMIDTCSGITTNGKRTSFLMHTIAATAIISIHAIIFAAVVGLSLKGLATTVVVRPLIILN